MSGISFNIKLNDRSQLSRFIELIFEVSNFFSAKSYFFEYTTDIEKIKYGEKTFNNFDEFKQFYDTENNRFDLLKLENKKNEVFIGFQQSNRDLRIFGIIENKDIIYKILDIVDGQLLYAYLHNQLDIKLSHTNKHRSWIRALGKIPDYVKVYKNPRFGGGERDEFLIDLETFPTHHHLIKTGDKLWFGACAEMYFSKLYYNYIPEYKWNRFTNCNENIVLGNGIRKIVLYDNLDTFDTAENRKKQLGFRKDLGMDIIARELKKNKHNNV